MDIRDVFYRHASFRMHKCRLPEMEVKVDVGARPGNMVREKKKEKTHPRKPNLVRSRVEIGRKTRSEILAQKLPHQREHLKRDTSISSGPNTFLRAEKESQGSRTSRAAAQAPDSEGVNE